MAAAFVLSLTAMVGAKRWYDDRRAVPALVRLEQLPGVRWARLGQGPAGRTLWVAVEPVEDLTALVGALRRAASVGELAGVREIVLVDRRNEQLSRALSRMELALQEGAFSGAFLRMEQHVSRLAAKMGVQARLFVDQQAVYVLLRSGSHHLYEVIPRPQPASWPGQAVPVQVRAEGPGAAAAELRPASEGAAQP